MISRKWIIVSFRSAAASSVSISRPQGLADRRVGEIRLGEAVRGLSAQVAALLEGPWAEEVGRGSPKVIRPKRRSVLRSAKLMTRIFAGRGLIFLDPMSPDLHRLSLPTMLRAVKEHKALAAELVARSEALEKAGFHAQVKVAEQSTLVFRIVDGQRLALRPANGGLAAGNKTESIDETLKAMEEHPEDFSPSALLRPVIQDTLLPTVAYIGGPAEVAYHAQTSLIYKKLLGRAPAILPRAGFTLVPAHVSNLLKKYNLDAREILQGRHRLARDWRRRRCRKRSRRVLMRANKRSKPWSMACANRSRSWIRRWWARSTRHPRKCCISSTACAQSRPRRRFSHRRPEHA